VMVWVQIGYPVVIFMAALQRVDPELYEAAELDGAGWFRRFRSITITIIRPEIFVVTLTCTIAALKVFGPVFTLTRGGPGNATIVPSYYSYTEFFDAQQVGYGATIATALTVVIGILTVAFIRAQNRVEAADREI
jgi:raffinose/stachyose/melibiose transport system permease protein